MTEAATDLALDMRCVKEGVEIARVSFDTLTPRSGSGVTCSWTAKARLRAIIQDEGGAHSEGMTRRRHDTTEYSR